jgi:mutator protein MutT
MPTLDDFTFNALLKQRIAQRVASFQDDRHSETSLKAAAVAITIINHDNEGAVIVTRRAPRLKDHGGQWALPGGRIDNGETATEAALRELHEEVNLALPAASVLGTLDDYVTRSGFVITPVVVWTDIVDIDLVPDPVEVESIHSFTFRELARTDSPRLESIPESDRQVLSMNFFDSWIYAPTAAMLYQFREVAFHNRHTRVAHYDGPVFTWK